MHDKLMLDTNIVLDMAMRDRPDHYAALELLDEIEMKEATACLCATSLKDIYYVLTKYMGERDARQYVRALLAVIELYPVDAQICYQALCSNEPDFEDGIVRACAENAKATYLISRDSSAFEVSPIKRMSAEGYLRFKGHWEEVDLLGDNPMA